MFIAAGFFFSSTLMKDFEFCLYFRMGYFGGYGRSRIVLAKNNQKELYLSAKAAILMEEKISR